MNTLENRASVGPKSEIRQLVERGLLQLPAKYRIIVMLRDINFRIFGKPEVIACSHLAKYRDPQK